MRRRQSEDTMRASNQTTETPEYNPDNFAATCRTCGNGTLNNAAIPAFKILGGFEPYLDEIYIVCRNCGSHHVNVQELNETAIICVNCGHTKDDHWDRYGCQVEGPDIWKDGDNCGGWVAQGPCGCTDFVKEEAFA